jgi:hypothetical protein
MEMYICILIHEVEHMHTRTYAYWYIRLNTCIHAQRVVDMYSRTWSIITYVFTYMEHHHICIHVHGASSHMYSRTWSIIGGGACVFAQSQKQTLSEDPQQLFQLQQV